MKTIPYSHQSISDADVELVADVLKSDWLTQGPKIKEFEGVLCEYTGAKYVVAVSSGTAALHLACLAAGLKEGDEVITSPITFVASANAVVYCSAKPVFADIQTDTVNIDPEEIKKKITKNTKAIISVDFAGHPADLAEVRDIAKKDNLIVIEDAAHALGAEYRCSKVGSCEYSDMTTFSFHPVKHITTGEGGAVTTNRKDIYEKLLMLRSHGITKDKNIINPHEGEWYYEQHYLGYNYRITDIQCALGIGQMKRLNDFVVKRRSIADIYKKSLSEFGGLILPIEKPDVKSSWHIYCIRLHDHSSRREVFDKLRSSGLGVQVHYIPVHLQPYYRDRFGYKAGDYPVAENYYKRAITIPLYPSMKENEVDFVIEMLKRVVVFSDN